jgi:hypothetical protein
MENKDICKCGRQMLQVPLHIYKKGWVCPNPECPENKPDDYEEVEPIRRRKRNEELAS